MTRVLQNVEQKMTRRLVQFKNSQITQIPVLCAQNESRLYIISPQQGVEKQNRRCQRGETSEVCWGEIRGFPSLDADVSYRILAEELTSCDGARVVNWLSFKIIENKFYCFTPSRAGDTLLWTLTTALWENYWNQVDTHFSGKN